MRIWSGSLVACCAVTTVIISAAAAAAESFPYQGAVIADAAPLRSGPSEDDYVTDQLARESRVQVYRRENDWLAIRPPKGSYSWVDAERLELTENAQVARVIGDDVPSWIASREERLEEHVARVRLDRGELVRVLGKRTMSGAEGTKTWYKIAPPSGEFRWIHRRFVRRIGNADPAAESTVAEQDEMNEGSSVETADHDADLQASQKNVKSAQFVARSKDRAAGNGASRAARRKTTTPTAAEEDDFAHRLERINLQLSLMVSKPSRKWELQRLHEETEQLIDTGTTALERGRGRLLLETIRQFIDLHERLQDASDAAGLALADEEGGVSANSQPIGTGVNNAAYESDARYDGTGWLLPVHSKKRIVPPYALLDREGNVLFYVSPSPGLNLHRYLRKEIGIMGQRGYIPELKNAHLMAERVIDLDRHR